MTDGIKRGGREELRRRKGREKLSLPRTERVFDKITS